MRRLVVLLIVVLAAVGLPTGASEAQPVETVCEDGIAVEGRCLSVDEQAALCLGGACVEFVEESVDLCPGGAINVEPNPLRNVRCELTEPASERDPACPEGARGEFGACFIYVAIGSDGCPSPSVIDVTGNCRRGVGDAPGAIFCKDDATLAGQNCTSMIDAVPSPCPAQTSRFDQACWRLNGLVAPESCAGHQVAGTIELSSGRCQVPLTIPTGPTTCVDGAEYRDYPSFILINQSGDNQGLGPSAVACVADAASVGIIVRYCYFTDDDNNWGDVGDEGLCTRYELPVVVTCPSDYSIDDSLGGQCRRFEAAVNGQCPVGGTLNGSSCVFGTEFAEFECPAETDRHSERPICVAYRTWQGAVLCGESSALLETDVPEFGLQLGCFPHSGPQPDRCNGEGTLESCFEVREPALVECNAPWGCVGLGAVAKTCAGKLVTIDMNQGALGTGTAGVDVILGTPGDDVIRGFGGDDSICGGDGRDRLYGGPGDDTINGGFGIDYVWGDAGDDTLNGEGGSDRMFGGADNDLMLGDSGADRMYGGDGDDEMRGMGGQDFMWGETGNDLMQGNFQTDNMWGGPGDDTMFGAGGKDSLFGEAGNDELSGGNNTDFLSGGLGVDSANGGRGRDKPVIAPQVRASNGQFFDGSGCIAETIVNCQPTP